MLTSTITYFVSRDSVSIHLPDGTSGVVRPEHKDFGVVKEILNKNVHDDADVETLRSIIDAASAVKEALASVATGDLVFTGDDIQFRGRSLNLEAARRIIELAQNGFNIDRMLKFLNKLINNPYPSAVNELWQFMEASSLPIDEDGNLIAYKIVGKDYKDIYSGTFDNSIGASPEVKPFEVDPDRNNTCSRGLHVCGKDYLPHFGNYARGDDHVMIVKVDPSQVVAVPADYNNHKMRVWKYTVIGEISGRERAGILEKRGAFNTGDGASFINYGGTLSDEQRAKAMSDLDDIAWNGADLDQYDSTGEADGDRDVLKPSIRDADTATSSFFIRDEYNNDVYHPASVDEVREGFNGGGSSLFDLYAFHEGQYVPVTNNRGENRDPIDEPDDWQF